jgi:hypothetical protein
VRLTSPGLADDRSVEALARSGVRGEVGTCQVVRRLRRMGVAVMWDGFAGLLDMETIYLPIGRYV